MKKHLEDFFNEEMDNATLRAKYPTTQQLASLIDYALLNYENYEVRMILEPFIDEREEE